MPGEIVLYRGETARRAHREAFGLPEHCYVPLREDLLSEIRGSAAGGVSRLHVLSVWEDMLRIALWSGARPARVDVFDLLRRASAAESDLAPFRDADIGDIFPSLYYGKRFDLLRKVCHAAKARAEMKIGRKDLIVHCHLVPEDGGLIVASNL